MRTLPRDRRPPRELGGDLRTAGSGNHACGQRTHLVQQRPRLCVEVDCVADDLGTAPAHQVMHQLGTALGVDQVSALSPGTVR